MMSRIRIPLLAFALLALGTAYLPAASAQTPGSAAAISELPGIQSGIARTWSLDYEAIMSESSPESVDLNNWQGLTALSVQVLQFDGEANAQNAYDALSASIAGEIANLGQEGTPAVANEELANLGDAAVASTLVTTTDIGDTHLRNVAVLDDRIVIIVSALAGTAESASSAEALAAYVVNEGEVSPDPIAFDPAGLSKGGLWGVLPPAGNAVLEGLIALRDDQLYPVPRVDA
ncbi:MAG TPA: hypothetical protein VD767_10180 [Thermomicrobiales bacterium]|nr:hypothetical protein [Thermomicrobiales bacterium]